MVARSRLSGVSPLARASKRSKPEDVAKIFKEVDTNDDGLLSLEELQSYLGEYLGYGDAEIAAFYREHANAAASGVDLAGFQAGFATLNPYTISKRKAELVIRKPGSVCAKGAQMQLEELAECTVLVCDRTEQAFVDECNGCRVLIGPCASSTFVRDCKDCVFWVATRQLRTRDCHNCKFFLYTFTEPIIESSDNLGFAPFAASYPGLTRHFTEAGFVPERNFWSALFDFTGKAGAAHWRILPLEDCQELQVNLPSEGVAAWDCPTAALTQELLCAPPPRSDESSEGASQVANIPQTRPHHPAAGPVGTKPQRLEIGEVSLVSVQVTPVETKAAVISSEPKKALRKPKWTTIKALSPTSRGVNIFATVESVSGSEVLLSDKTGSVTLRAAGDQCAVCVVGEAVRIQNAKVVTYQGSMRLVVDKWGVLKPAPASQ